MKSVDLARLLRKTNCAFRIERKTLAAPHLTAEAATEPAVETSSQIASGAAGDRCAAGHVRGETLKDIFELDVRVVSAKSGSCTRLFTTAAPWPANLLRVNNHARAPLRANSILQVVCCASLAKARLICR